MSLRDSLMAAVHGKVASCAPHATQHATLGVECATAHATITQLPPANPHESSIPCATGSATGAQQASCAAPGSDPPNGAPVARGSITQRRTAAALIDAIKTACRLRGDTDANIAGLIAEAGDFTVEAQVDLIGHFVNEAAIWRAVSASGHVPAATPVSRAPIRPVPSVKTCPQCANRLRLGTCGRPIEAGLIDPLAGFGIVWAPPGHAATCPSFTAKAPRS